MQHVRTIATPLLLVGLHACTDPVVPQPRVMPDSVGAAATVAGQAQLAVNEFRPVARFAVQLAVEGQLRPNSPIALYAHVTALEPTARARVRIILPEVEVARANAWQSSDPVAGQPLPPVYNREHSATSAFSTDRVRLTIPVEGYYRVLVSVSTDAPGTLPDGRISINTVHHVRWLRIDEKGGQVTTEFEPTAGREEFPAGGAFVQRRRGVASVLSQVTHTVNYLNHDNGAFTALANAMYQVRIYQGSTQLSNTVGQLDAGGSFSHACLTSGQRALVQIYYQRPNYLNVQRNATDLTKAYEQNWYGPLCTSLSYVLAATGLNDYGAHVFVTGQAVIDGSRAFFGYTRPKITYKLSTILNDSYFDEGNDRIQIDTASVFNVFGRFVISHEYGHALHYSQLGGLQTGGGPACPTHTYDQEINLRCGLNEGFADYHAVAAFSAADHFTIEDLRPTTVDGSIKEGAVAAFLWDLTDTNQEAFDGAAYSGNYIATIIKTCNVQDNHSWPGYERANGIDHHIWCLEKAATTTLYSSYFPLRAAAGEAFGYTESATEPGSWSASVIRTLWLKNLYLQ